MKILGQKSGFILLLLYLIPIIIALAFKVFIVVCLPKLKVSIVKARRIFSAQNFVFHVCIQIHIAAAEADRVFGDEAADVGVVESGTAVLQTGQIVVFTARELVAGGKSGVRSVSKTIVTIRSRNASSGIRKCVRRAKMIVWGDSHNCFSETQESFQWKSGFRLILHNENTGGRKSCGLY